MNKRQLYESIMTKVAKEVKAALNEAFTDKDGATLDFLKYDDLSEEEMNIVDPVFHKSAYPVLYGYFKICNDKSHMIGKWINDGLPYYEFAYINNVNDKKQLDQNTALIGILDVRNNPNKPQVVNVVYGTLKGHISAEASSEEGKGFFMPIIKDILKAKAQGGDKNAKYDNIQKINMVDTKTITKNRGDQEKYLNTSESISYKRNKLIKGSLNEECMANYEESTAMDFITLYNNLDEEQQYMMRRFLEGMALCQYSEEQRNAYVELAKKLLPTDSAKTSRAQVYDCLPIMTRAFCGK